MDQSYFRWIWLKLDRMWSIEASRDSQISAWSAYDSNADEFLADCSKHWLSPT